MEDDKNTKTKRVIPSWGPVVTPNSTVGVTDGRVRDSMMTETSCLKIKTVIFLYFYKITSYGKKKEKQKRKEKIKKYTLLLIKEGLGKLSPFNVYLTGKW